MTDEPTRRLPGASRRGDGRHPSPDAIADHTEGLLPEASAATLEEHLAGCPSCRETAASLIEVRRLLAGLPDPGPMPADVVARLDAGLAAAATGATAEIHGDSDRGRSEGPTTVVPLSSRRRPVRRLLQAAAAVVLVGGGAALLGPSLLNGGGSDDEAQTTAADSSAERAASVPADAPAAARGAQIVWLTSSGLDYSASAIPEAARSMLSRQSPYDRPAVADGRQSTFDTTAAPAPLSEENVGSAVSMCALTVGATPLAIDAAQYAGQPAWLVVRPGAAGRVEAWVVPPGCPMGETLYFVNVPTS